MLFQFEADRRALIITINSFDTELTKEDRARLFPNCGKLNPDGLAALARADDYEQVRSVAEYYAEYQNLFATAGNNPDEKTLEDRFFEHEVRTLPSGLKSASNQASLFGLKKFKLFHFLKKTLV